LEGCRGGMVLMAARRRLKGLYLVVDPKVSGVLEKVERALRGGVDILQLWSGEGREREELASRLLRLARTYGVPLLVHEDLELAMAIGADGLHLDGKRPTPQEVRERLGAEALVGLTCGGHLEEVRWAKEQGADYVSFCSVFPTKSVKTCDLVPLELIREAKMKFSIPIFASGGITLENVDHVLATGVDGIALISAILEAPDPEEAARAFKERMDEGAR